MGFYVAGLAVMIGLAVWGIALTRFEADAGMPPGPEGAGGAPSAQDATRPAVKVSITDFVYDPKELVIPAGTTVTWVNADDVPHTVTSTASPRAFGSRALDKDDTFSFVFRTAGTYGTSASCTRA
jgi:plastocyanin